MDSGIGVAMVAENGATLEPTFTTGTVTPNVNEELPPTTILSRAMSTIKGRSKKPSPIAKSLHFATLTAECISCADEVVGYVELGCRHTYCKTCIETLFINAAREEARYPPRCCKPIPLADGVLEMITPTIRDNFLMKEIEWKTKTRNYCSNHACNQFINPKDIRFGTAHCKTCKTRTCVQCKQKKHKLGEKCTGEDGLKPTRDLMKKKHWRECGQCKNGIERTGGCSHMQCICGFAFCYNCGREWPPTETSCGCAPPARRDSGPIVTHINFRPIVEQANWRFVREGNQEFVEFFDGRPQANPLADGPLNFADDVVDGIPVAATAERRNRHVENFRVGGVQTETEWQGPQGGESSGITEETRQHDQRVLARRARREQLSLDAEETRAQREQRDLARLARREQLLLGVEEARLRQHEAERDRVLQETREDWPEWPRLLQLDDEDDILGGFHDGPQDTPESNAASNGSRSGTSESDISESNTPEHRASETVEEAQMAVAQASAHVRFACQYHREKVLWERVDGDRGLVTRRNSI